MDENQQTSANPAVQVQPPVNPPGVQTVPVVPVEPAVNQPKRSNKKLPFIIIAALILISVLTLAILNWKVFIPKREKLSIVPAPEKTQANIFPEPKVTFAAYTDKTVSKPIPVEPSNYMFKSDYQKTDINDLARNLSVSQLIKQQDNYYLFSDSLSGTKEAAMIFDKNNGNLFYMSSAGQPLSLTTGNVEGGIITFLDTRGLWDSTFSITASYKQKNEPDLTFYEIHRDWGKVGLPILNPIGLLNMGENTKLSSLSLTSKTQNMMVDDNVIDTTDNKDGLARQTDFNTMTVAVSDKSQKIFLIKSNLRKISSTTQKQNLISYTDAFKELKNGKTDYFFTTPAGNGFAQWNKVYPDNKAISQNAFITDSAIAYLEKPGVLPEGSMEPYYVFRGYADLKSGYRVNFIAAVKATAKTTSLMPVAIGQVYAQEKTIQLKTFTPTPTPRPTVPPPAVTSPSSNYTPPPAGSTSPVKICTPAEGNLSPLVTLSGLGTIGYWSEGPGYSSFPNYYKGWFLIQNGPNPSAKATIVAVFLPLFYSGELNQYLGREITSATVAWSPWSDPSGCPMRLTFESPTLFIYGNTGSKVSLAINSSVIYIDPPVLSNKFSIRVLDKEGKIVINNQFERNYIYYEYDKSKVSFNKPNNGWVIEKNKISQFVKEKISPSLKLTKLEEERTIFEINNAAIDIQSQYIFVGLIDQNEISSKLPLDIKPKPETLLRFHFSVGKASKIDKFNPPNLTPVDRSLGSLIVEFGSYSE
ncbi:MAG: hypothetical protein M1268_03745 [Patescibacteria group bacterium]|nr:hypothetical protein [Patescibacteria group bacterium]